MTEQAPLMFMAGGIVAVLMWLAALGLYMHYMLRMQEGLACLTIVDLSTRVGLLLGTVGWGSYVALTWPQLSWRVALLPLLALATLTAYTVWTRHISGFLLSLCSYAFAVIAYGVALASLRTGDIVRVSIASPVFALAVTRDLAAVIAAGALLTYSAMLFVRNYAAQTFDRSRVEHLCDGTTRIALIATTVTLAAAAWRAWSAWGEMARSDVAMAFIAWVLVVMGLWWQMMTGRVITWITHGLALSALALLTTMLVLAV